MTGRRNASGAHRTLWRFVPIIILALALAAAYGFGLHKQLTLSALAESRSALKAMVDAHPLFAAAAFVLLYAIAIAGCFPAASLLTVFSGFLFGWVMGGLLVVLAATAGATVLFLVARTAFGDVLRRRIGGHAARLAKGFEDDAFAYLLVLRLAPIFPFWMVNIAPAFFDVRLKTYIAATALGIIPGTFAYAYLGRGLESVLVAAAQSGSALRVRDLVTPELTLAFAALAAVALIALVVKRTRTL